MFIREKILYDKDKAATTCKTYNILFFKNYVKKHKEIIGRKKDMDV